MKIVDSTRKQRKGWKPEIRFATESCWREYGYFVISVPDSNSTAYEPKNFHLISVSNARRIQEPFRRAKSGRATTDFLFHDNAESYC